MPQMENISLPPGERYGCWRHSQGSCAHQASALSPNGILRSRQTFLEDFPGPLASFTEQTNVYLR